MRHTNYFVLFVLWWACATPADVTPTESDSSTVVALPAIAVTREQVKETPVAQYEKKVPNDLNNWKFEVALFETRNRFNFLVKMKFQEITGKDTISIPNLGVEPILELKPGSSQYSCVIGFLDKQGNFKPYKEVVAKGDRLKITTLKYYTTSTVVQ